MCNTDNPDVATRRIETAVGVKTVCKNENCCQRENTWHSHPDFPSMLIHAGNLILSFGILLGGGSASKVFHILDHIGLACISLATFFSHQKVSFSGFRSICFDKEILYMHPDTRRNLYYHFVVCFHLVTIRVYNILAPNPNALSSYVTRVEAV